MDVFLLQFSVTDCETLPLLLLTAFAKDNVFQKENAASHRRCRRRNVFGAVERVERLTCPQHKAEREVFRDPFRDAGGSSGRLASLPVVDRPTWDNAYTHPVVLSLH